MPFGGLLTAGIGAAGSIFGGLFGANASSKASKQYLNALKQAQTWMQGQEQLGLGNFQPYLSAGTNASGMLSQLLSTPGEGLLTPWTQQFKAPTAEEAAQTPGYQFQLEQGLGAAQNSAAARGGLLSGGTLAGLNQYAQGLASTNYQNTFNNALTQYQNAYQSFLNNQNNTYSRLMGLSGQGLQAASGAGGLISGIGSDIASLYAQQGAAQAGGTLGSANSILGMIPGLSGSLSQILSKIPGLGGGGGGGVDPNDPSICWVASAIYDEDIRFGPRVNAIRDWLKRTPYMQAFINLYKKIGLLWASKIKQDNGLHRRTKVLFDGFLKEALA